MSATDRIRAHFEESMAVKQASLAVLVAPIAEAAALLATTLRKDGKILSCGNGGSAGDAQHFAAELLNRFEMERLFLVPPGAFNPAPKVESAVVRMIPRPRAVLAATDEALLGEIVKSAFAQRRKMLRNTLRERLSEADWAALGIAPTRRAEELAVGDYVRIANRLAEAGITSSSSRS